MNKDELAKILKPLIKECVKEVIMEEPGVLAHIIKESVQGVSVSTITESRDEEPYFQTSYQPSRQPNSHPATPNSRPSTPNFLP